VTTAQEYALAGLLVRLAELATLDAAADDDETQR